MFFKDFLHLLQEKGLLRTIRDRGTYINLSNAEVNQQTSNFQEYCGGASRIIINGNTFINFSSNDYLGLSNNEEIIKAAVEATYRYGFGAGASRLLSGGTELHKKLEDLIAKFKKTQSSLILNSGYTANTSVIPALVDENDVILSDELNHASIIDGIRLSKAKKLIYKHCDSQHLYELIKNSNARRKLVITDTVFSMDGDIAPLKEIYEVCEQTDALLYLDDAHGTGVLGEGKGALAHFNIEPKQWIIQMGTLSKALGAFGAFIAADSEIIQWLINKSRGLIFSTALPPCIIAASIKALEIVEKEKNIVEKLWKNRQRLYESLLKLGYNTLNSQTPIIPLIPPKIFSSDDTNNVLSFSKYLETNYIYAPAIRPPTVKIPRLRLSITATHTPDDIEKLTSILKQIT